MLFMESKYIFRKSQDQDTLYDLNGNEQDVHVEASVNRLFVSICHGNVEFYSVCKCVEMRKLKASVDLAHAYMTMVNDTKS